MLNFRQKFGKRLKELRKLKGLSQEAFAEIIDITPRNLSKIETGQTFPSTDNLEKIILNLDCKPHMLFKFSANEELNMKKQISQKIENMSDDKLKLIFNFIELLE